MRRATPAPSRSPSADTDGTDRAPASSRLPFAARMEAAFSRDFSSVEVETGEASAMKAIGAEAAAEGESVSFASASPSPWLVAHELAHVVQARENGGASTGRSLKAAVSTSSSPAEKEADAVADRVVSTGVAGPIREAPGALVQRFAPGHHEEATVGGLAGTFSREEIAAIYQANWERDFSQGNPQVASAAIAWSAVKRAAAGPKAAFLAAAKTFKSAVWAVVDLGLIDAMKESLGGSEDWEHFDNPGSSGAKNADKRWAGARDGLAGYIMDAKAHAKDQMVAAIDFYRLLEGRAGVGGSIDNWKGGAKPKGYVAPAVTKTKGRVVATVPDGHSGPNVADRAPVRKDTIELAKKAGAKSSTKFDADTADTWRLVGQHLGRAMHAVEDFWAHSNWLELAKALHGHASNGASVEMENATLFTGTFRMPSKAHSFGHKLLALSRAFLRDFNLMLKIYGRRRASTLIRNTKKGISGKALGPLHKDSDTPLGEMWDVAEAAGVIKRYAQTSDTPAERDDAVGDFLTSRLWLKSLRIKAKIMIAEGDQESGKHSHAKIAKDGDEDGKDHRGAQALATKANQLIFGPLRAIMDEKDPTKALAATRKQLALLDVILTAPSTNHPLWSTFLKLRRSK